MNINKMSELLNFMGLGRKVEKTNKVSSDPLNKVNAQDEVSGSLENADSVSISSEGVIKEASMKIQADLFAVREEKVAHLKERIASGQYQVNPEDVARAIIEGRPDNQEELR